MSCDVGKAVEGLENELCGATFSNPYIASPTSQIILQAFRRFAYVTAHSTALPLLQLRQALHLRHLSSRQFPYDDV